MMGRRAFIDAAALASNDAHRAAVAQGLAGVGGRTPIVERVFA
jgi:hypothetical protein